MSAKQETQVRRKIKPRDGCTQGHGFHTGDICREGEREKNMSLLQDFWLHATTGCLQGKLCEAIRVVQSWNGKRPFNSLPRGWKHSITHPALPWVLPDSSSARGTSLTPLVLLLLAQAPPHSSALAMGLAMAPACPLPRLDPLSPLPLSPQLLVGGKSSTGVWYFAVFFPEVGGERKIEVI